MDDAAIHTASHILPDDLQCILCCIPAMDHKRKLFLSGNIQLGTKHFLLFPVFFPFLVPVVIQADLANSYHLVHPGNPSDLIQCIPAHLVCIIRMHTYCPVYERIFLCKLYCTVELSYGSTYIHNMPYALLLHLAQKFFPVRIKSFIIIMGMCIKDHLYCLLFLLPGSSDHLPHGSFRLSKHG